MMVQAKVLFLNSILLFLLDKISQFIKFLDEISQDAYLKDEHYDQESIEIYEQIEQESPNTEQVYYIENEDGTSYELTEQTQQQTNKMVIKCPICGQNFIILRKLKRHFLNHKQKIYKISQKETSQCKICFEILDSYQDFLKHAYDKHLIHHLESFVDN